MPFYYRDEKHPSLSGFYYRSQTYAGVSIVSITGTVRRGGTITVTTTGLATINTATLGGEALTISTSAGNVHELIIGTYIPLRVGDSYTLAVGDGVDSASQSVTLQNLVGWESVNVNYAGSPPDPGTTSSFRELLLNYLGYTLVDGDQILWESQPNFSVHPRSTPLFEDITEASGIFSVFDNTNGVYLDLDPGAGVANAWNFYIQDPDPTPDAFDFADVTDADLSTVYTSAPVVLADFNEQLAVTITGGEYSINGGAFTSAPGVYDLGDSVVVRGTSSANYSTAANVVLTVGGVSGTYTITTAAAPADTVPDAFDFANVADAEPSTATQTNTITVAGINAASPITVTGGEYQINGGAWTSAAGNVVLDDVVRARGTSSASFGGVVNVTLTIGGVSDAFSITTRAADTLADQFTFSDVTDATQSTEYSALVTITGIEAAIPASVTGGEMSINGGARVTSGNVSNNDQVRVYATSSANYSTAVNAILSVGSGGEVVSDTFTITTGAAPGDSVPDAFGFTAADNVALSTLTTSNAVTITGLTVPAVITISGGDAQYSINGGVFTSSPGTITNGQTVRVRITSSGTELTEVVATLIIGGVSGTFSVTTFDAFDPGDLTAIYAELSVFPLHREINGRFPLYAENATEIRLHNTATDEGETLSSLTVSAQLQSMAGVAVGDPVVLTHDADNPGNYEGVFVPEGHTVQNPYTLVCTVSTSGVTLAQFNLPVIVVRRGQY